MLNQQEKMEILKRLRFDSETEMSRDDLETMLEQELAKPEEKMDAELVQEILELLEDGVSEEEQQASWKQIAKRLPGKRGSSAIRWAARIAAVLAVVLCMTVLTYRTAEAFNWQLLLKWMRPFAETFMLYSGEQPGEGEARTTTQREQGTVYGDSSKEGQSRQFAALEEAPERLCGYPARPLGMPERFAYVQGSQYTDDLTATATHVFQADDGICIFYVMMLTASNETASHQYEKTIDETMERTIAGYPVTYYFNSDEATMSASWTIDNAQYSIFGAITEAELAQIVESTMNQ